MSGSERLSSEAFAIFETYLGLSKAEEIAQEVRDGELSASEAEQWSQSVQQTSENARNRPDIEPEDWQKFEEGWRPEGW